MGDADERRTRPKLVRYSPAELVTVTDRARVCGRPVACYIREASLGAVPRARHAHANDLVIRCLARAATQLTQLAREARERELPAAASFAAAVSDVLDAIRQLD